MSKPNISQIRTEFIQFVLLAIAITWGVFLSALYLGAADSPIVILGIPGPLVAALIMMTKNHGWQGVKDHFKRLGQFRFSWKWYLVIILSPTLMALAGLYGYFLLTGTEMSLNEPFIGTWIIPTLVIQLIIVGIGEEMGWRGYGLLRLQSMTSPLKASLILGAIHLLWHIPTYWLGTGFHNVPLIWSAIYVIAFSVIFTRVYNATGGSILAAALFHAFSNIALSLTHFKPRESVIPLTPDLISMTWLADGQMGPYLSVLLVYVLVAAVIIWRGFGTPPDYETIVPSKTASKRPILAEGTPAADSLSSI